MEKTLGKILHEKQSIKRTEQMIRNEIEKRKSQKNLYEWFEEQKKRITGDIFNRNVAHFNEYNGIKMPDGIYHFEEYEETVAFREWLNTNGLKMSIERNDELGIYVWFEMFITPK